MNSQTSALYKNNNKSQEEGNNILIYPTPITNSSGRGTLESDSIPEEIKVATATATIPKKKNSYFKKIQRLGALTTSYFKRLFKRMGSAHSKNERNSAVRDTATTTNDNNKTCWRKRLKFQRKESNSTRKEGPKFVWYFRPVGAAAAFKSSSHKSLKWTEFEKKNQVELSRQLSLLNHHATTKDTFEIQDKNIFNNTVVVTVMLKESIAFVLDPEWSKPITYEISPAPKLHWYQEIYMRHKYRQMIRKQHKAFLKASKIP